MFQRMLAAFVLLTGLGQIAILAAVSNPRDYTSYFIWFMAISWVAIGSYFLLKPKKL